MNLADITTKCYILALIIRDDGERLLLGDGAYEFKDSQQHFIANTYANDVVELQGTDGQMLAGQVRRTSTQTFSGYIGDATFSKQKIETARRNFLMFFRKKHYYTAVYVFSDGTAIQRDRGYIVNAPSAPELYQRFPEWSIGINFEDPNYYEYAEDDLGHEIAAHKAELELSTAMSGGLIWDGDGAVSDDLSYVGTEIEGEGKNFQLTDTGTATLKSAELLGDAEQTTYSGKNLWSLSSSYTNSTSTGTWVLSDTAVSIPAGTYTLSWTKTPSSSISNFNYKYADNVNHITSITSPTVLTFEQEVQKVAISLGGNTTISDIQLEAGSTATAYEPYVGGTASPNPDYPQAVNTVTGEQTVKIEGSDDSQEFEINLGKNLCPDTSEGYWVGSGGTNAGRTANDSGVAIPVQPNTYYTVSTTTTQARYRCAWADATTTIGGASLTTTLFFSADNTSGTHTASSGSHKYLIINATDLSAVQLELGSTATDYAPYFTPIELCKIGTYQDRIYKDAGKWYIEKQVGKKIFDGTEAWTYNSANQVFALPDAIDYARDGSAPMSDLFIGQANVDNYVQLTDLHVALLKSTAQNRTIFKNLAVGASEYYFKTWLASNPTTVYYALATPTTTEITNQALIGQLERLRHAHTYANLTNFSITATSPNLPAFLKVVAFGDDAIPQGGYVWEDGGTGGATTITVDGVDNAQPIWTVVGPATNPSLTNITTGESIQWTGVVPNGQTLVVNMADMTASLSGANVFEFISGSWITLQAGNNRVSYSATAATGIATLEWNGVVG